MEHPDFARIRAIPLHQYLGLELVSAEAGTSRVELSVGPSNQNANQVLHGGVLYAVCDVAAFAALLSVLPADLSASTHDLHVSAMRPAPSGSRVVFTGQVLRKGRSLAFIDAQVHIGDRLIATARVTKSLAPARVDTSA